MQESWVSKWGTAKAEGKSPIKRPYAPGKGWENFDEHATKLVAREIDFEAFTKATKKEVANLAWAAIRRRRPPAWMDITDVQVLILGHIWYYAFEHRCRSEDHHCKEGPQRPGRIGYDGQRHESAGAYLRWNASQHVQKDLGKARGENMNTHRLFGPPPEALSSTGDVDAVLCESQGGSVEVEIDDNNRRAALARITQATKDFVVQAEVAKTFRKTNKATKKVKVREFLIKSEPARTDLKTLGIKRNLKCETADCLLEFIVRGLGSAGAASSSEAKKSEEEAPCFGAHPKK